MGVNCRAGLGGRARPGWPRKQRHIKALSLRQKGRLGLLSPFPGVRREVSRATFSGDLGRAAAFGALAFSVSVATLRADRTSVSPQIFHDHFRK